MAERDPILGQLGELIKRMRAAAEALKKSQAELEELHGRVDWTDASPTMAVITDADLAAAEAEKFGDTLEEAAAFLAAALDAVEGAAKAASGEEGLPPESTRVTAAGKALSAACATIAQDITGQGEALGEQALATVVQQLEASATSCKEAGTLTVGQMATFRAAAREMLDGLEQSVTRLAELAGGEATTAEQQIAAIEKASQAAVEAIASAGHAAATAYGTRSDDVEVAFHQARFEVEAQALRLEDGLSALLSARTAETQAAITAVSAPVQAAVEDGLRPCAAELGSWRAALEALAPPAQGLDVVAAELTRARDEIKLAQDTMAAMKQE